MKTKKEKNFHGWCFKSKDLGLRIATCETTKAWCEQKASKIYLYDIPEDGTAIKVQLVEVLNGGWYKFK